MFDFSSSAASLRRGRNAGAASDADPFEIEVKAIARRYFEGEALRRGVGLRAATKAPPLRWAHFFLLGAAFLALGLVPLVRGETYALVTSPVFCWIWMVNFWHDASHFGMSTSWRLNWMLTYIAPWFSSP